MSGRKVMLLGGIGVGKSSIVRRLVLNRFERDYKPTIGVDVYSYAVPPGIAGSALDLIIWDTDGNFGDAIFRHAYLKGAAAAIIVGDLTRPATLSAMTELASGFETALPGRYCGLVLNKLDLVPDPGPGVLPTDIRLPALPVLCTSAKNGTGVREVFHDAAASIVRRGS